MVVTQSNANDQTNVTDEMLDAFFAQAIERHQAEDWQAAEDFYRKVLDAMPEQPNVNYNLGLLKMQLNQSNASLDFFKAALSADQGEPKYWLSYAEALAEAGQKKAAVDILMQGIECGLHGEDVDRLVAQLTKPNPNSPIIINDTRFSNTNASSHEHAKEEFPVILVGGFEKPQPIVTKSKSIKPYLDNPQIKKVLDLQQAGKLKQANEKWIKLLKYYPNHPIILTCLGMIALEQGRINEGIKWIEQSLAIELNQTTALSYLSIAYLKLEKLDEALRCAEQAIALNPNYAEAYTNRGNVLRELKDYDNAIKSYQKTIALKPDEVDAKFNLGIIYKELKRYDQAINYLQEVNLLKPSDVEAQLACAETLLKLERYDEALKAYNVVIKQDENNAGVLFGRGMAHLSLKHFDLASIDFEQVIKLKPSYPNAHLNLGMTLRNLGRFEEAFSAYEIAIKQDQQFVQAYNNQALLCVDMCRFDEALELYQQAIKIDSSFGETYWHQALLYLSIGEFTKGWQLYEYRWQSVMKNDYRRFSKPLWLGDESLENKTLLIYPEQGFGDYIQFCRYVDHVEKLGAKVILEVSKPLVSLVSTLRGNFSIVEAGGLLPDFDYHCPIMSLPLAFKTQVETIPANTPYLYADKQKQQSWEKRLGQQLKPRVGIVWSGASGHTNDYHRSISLEKLKPLFDLPIEFHSLHNQVREADVANLADLNMLHTHQSALNDFSDTAALISQMDLVITVDTSVAHLAGAMGKECWVLIPSTPDFRWMLNRTDSPWYPSITLFRQPAFNDWTSVIESVREQLKEKISQV